MKNKTKAITTGESYRGIKEHFLANGLRVLLYPQPGLPSPVVTFLVVYHVGSVNEAVGYTGATHFLEHMMFKGTNKFSPQKGNGITDLLREIGALYNATTSSDRTNYFECGTTENLGLFVEIEADRMKNLLLRQEDRDSEMTVVRNEMERGENDQLRLLWKHMFATAYREHPYHHPTIGWHSDVEGVPLERLKRFYEEFYHPNNATCVVIGNFDEVEALRLVDKHFGPIPKSALPIPPVYTVEPPQEGERRFILRRTGDLPRFFIGYHVPEGLHEDGYVLTVMEALLGGDRRSSRLYRALVETGLAVDVSTYFVELRYPGMFIIDVTISPDKSAKAAEEAVLAEIDKLVTGEISERELRRVKISHRKSIVLANDDPMSLANHLTHALSVANWQWLQNYNDNLDRVDADKIKEIAGKYFSADNRTVGYYLPKESGMDSLPKLLSEKSGGNDKANIQEKQSAQEKQSIDSAKLQNEVAATAQDKPSPSSADPVRELLDNQKLVPRAKLVDSARPKQAPSVGTLDFGSRVIRRELSNGLVVLVLPLPGIDRVAISGKVKAGRYFETKAGGGDLSLRHVASSTAGMLSRGSQRFSKLQISEILEEMGSGLGINSDSFYVSFGNRVVADDLPAYMTVLSDVLLRPKFDPKDFDKYREETIAYLLKQNSQTDARAEIAAAQILYPEEHLHYASSYETRIERLKGIETATLADFHNKHFRPKGSVIAIVGDIDPDSAVDLIEEHFGEWSGGDDKSIIVPAVTIPSASQRINVEMPDKVNADITICIPVELQRTSPDYVAAVIANNALGRSTLSSRLGLDVRVKHGYTYGIHSMFSDPSYSWGDWSVSLSVKPENIEPALARVEAVVGEYLESGIERKELESEVGNATGSFAVGMRTTQGIANTLAYYEARGLTVLALDNYLAQIKALTVADVNTAARKYFTLDKAVIAVAGTLAGKVSK
jgi:zinc protease